MRGFDGLAGAIFARSAPEAAGGNPRPPKDADGRVGDFLRDVIKVCHHHRMVLSIDEDEKFLVEPLHEPGLEKIEDAWMSESFDA